MGRKVGFNFYSLTYLVRVPNAIYQEKIPKKSGTRCWPWLDLWRHWLFNKIMHHLNLKTQLKKKFWSTQQHFWLYTTPLKFSGGCGTTMPLFTPPPAKIKILFFEKKCETPWPPLLYRNLEYYVEGRVWPCGWVELNKLELSRSCMEISTFLVHSPTLFVHVKNTFMISMHEPGWRGLFSFIQRMNGCSCKEETTGTCTYPQNGIGKVSHRDPTLSFFWRPQPIRTECNLPKKTYLLNEAFPQVRHNFYDRIATTVFFGL